MANGPDSKKTILVVEDDRVALLSISAYLNEKGGFRVITAENGLRGLELLKSEKPDLVVTDIAMPEISGIDLLKQVVEQDPDLPVIIVSGVGTMSHVIEALRMGAKDYLQKPIQDMGLLIHSIERSLAHVAVVKQNKLYQDDLEWLVEKRTSELWEKNQELTEEINKRHETEAQLLQAHKLESVGQLAAGIAHEINTPTQFVSSNVDFLDESFGDLSELLSLFVELLGKLKEGAVADDYIAEIEDSIEEVDLEYLLEEIPTAIAQSRDGVKRVATIVSAMKEFSHPGGDTKEEVNLNQILKTTSIVARNEWKYVADLELELDETLRPTRCLSDEMGQVFLNIIVNAAHAIEEKLGKNPEGDKGQIRVMTRQGDGMAEIRISDTGAGIPLRAQHRIFDPFFTTKKVGKGTGQGLAIAHTVVTKKHGGTIHFETGKEKGTTFIIQLPQEKQKESA